MSLDNKELEFPCQYPIKIIGKSTESFKKNILKIIYSHFSEYLTDDLINFKQSKNNKYLSITIDFEAQSREHVDKIYQDLRSCSEVICLM